MIDLTFVESIFFAALEKPGIPRATVVFPLWFGPGPKMVRGAGAEPEWGKRPRLLDLRQRPQRGLHQQHLATSTNQKGPSMTHSSRRLSLNKVSLYPEPLERRDCPASLPGVLVTDVAVASAAVGRVIAEDNAAMPPSFGQDVVATELAIGQLFLDVRRITHSPLGRLAGPLPQLQQHLVQGFLAQGGGNTAGAQQGLIAQLSDLRAVFNALAGPHTNQKQLQADITTFLQETEALVVAAISNSTAVATTGAADQSALLAVLHDLVKGASAH
jgi:hypothetical protein